MHQFFKSILDGFQIPQDFGIMISRLILVYIAWNYYIIIYEANRAQLYLEAQQLRNEAYPQV